MGISRFTAAERLALLHLARTAVTGHLNGGLAPMVSGDAPRLLEPGAAFVTIRHGATRDLRGCRGEIEAYDGLAYSVIRSAVAAAVDDPRFEPVRLEEVEALHFHVSALTPLVRITVEAVEVGRHGLLLRSNGRSGLLLPEVAAEQGWDVRRYLEGLCRKANVDVAVLALPALDLYAFETESFGEDE